MGKAKLDFSTTVAMEEPSETKQFVKDEEYYDKIRQRAYLNWLAATGGNIIPEDPEGLRFWLQAEEEIATEAQL